MGIRLPCPIDEAFDLREDDEVLIQAPVHARSWRGMGLGVIGALERIRSLRQPLPLGCRVDYNVANDQGRAGPPIRYVALRLGGQSAIGLRSVCARAGLDEFTSGGRCPTWGDAGHLQRYAQDGAEPSVAGTAVLQDTGE